MQATAYSIMWKELTGQTIDQIVIMVSSEEGNVQNFIEKPINYVASLKLAIDKYYESRPVLDEVLSNIPK